MGLFDSAPDARKDSASLEKPSTGLFDSAPPLTRKRTWGEAATDTAKGLAAGVGSAVQNVGQLAGLVTGQMDNPITRVGESTRQYWDDSVSQPLKEKRARRAQAIEAAPDQLSKFGTAIAETITDPALLVDTAASTAASMVPAMGAGAAAAKLLGAGAGVAAGVGMGSAQAGADAAGGAFERARSAAPEVWAANPEYQRRVAAGEDPEAVKDAMALETARVAFVPAAGVSLASQALPGARAIERLAAGAGNVLPKLTRLANVPGAQRLAGAAKAGFGEAGQEAIEEGGGRLAGNLAEQQIIDPNTPTFAGVGEQAGLGAVGGFGIGAPIGALGHPATPPAGPLTRAAATITGAQAAPAPTAPPAQIAPAAPSATAATAEPAPAAQIPDAAVQVLSTAAKAGKAIGPQALAKAIGVDEAAATDMLRDFEARGLVSPPNKKGTRRVLLDPATGVLVDAEAAKADQRAAKKQAKAGAPAQAITATQEAQAGAPMFGPEAEARMAEKRATALSRLSRPNPAAGPASAAGAVAFDTGAADVAAQAAAQQDQQQAVAAQQQAESEQQRAIQQQEREALRLQKQAQQRRSMALQQQKMDAQTYDEEDVRAVIESMLDQGQRIDALRLGKQMGVKPRVVDNIRRAVFLERSKRREAQPGEVIDAEFTDVTQPGAARALPPPDQRPGQIKAVQQADAQARQLAAGMPTQATAAPASPAQATVAPDDTPEVLDDDITLPSGEPFTIRGAAELAAKRNPGARVVQVDGGFVARLPRATIQESGTVPALTAHPTAEESSAVPAPSPATVKDSLTVAAEKPKEAIATDVAGEQLDDKWTAFAPETGTLNVPRAQMPQIKSAHRGAMVQFLGARGIASEQAEVPADSLKPTQAEFSAAKVKKAIKRAAEGEDRAILVSADGHVLDGHHQWLSKREAGAPVKVIRLGAPIAQLLEEIKQFPSAQTADGATQAKPEQTQPEQTNAEQTPRPEQAPAAGQAAEAASKEGEALLSPRAAPAKLDSPQDAAQDGTTEEGANGTPESDGAPALDTAPAGKGRGAEEAGATGSSTDSGSPPRVGTDSGADGAGVSGPRGGRGGKGRVPAAETGAAAGGRLGGPRAGRARKGVPGAVTLPAEAVASTEPTNVPAINFRIDAELELGKGGEVGKFNDNVAAIRTLKQLEAERRRATPEEQRILARWVGWGGLASAFPNPETGKFKDGWEKRGNELRDLLTPSEYQAARRSTRNAHFTSETVVGFMWDAVRKLGYRGGLALESSMGSGNFLGLMPDDIGPTKFIGVEYDSITARLAAALYPQATVLHSGFQSVPLPNDSFDLSIGNPPFGNESLRFQYKPELRGLSIHNQFFLAAMDALKPGGLQVQVVSNFLLDAQDSQARRMLADRADLVAAFRLPDTAFKENARTEVVTDILILRKREYRLSEMAKGKDGKPTDPSWPEWVGTGTAPDPLGGDPIPLNNYFIQNPDHIIGTLERSGKMRAAGMPNVRLEDPSTLGARLQDMLGRLRPLGRLTETTAERTERAHKLLSEAMGIAVANQEPGHMAFDAAGGLVRVIEREHGDETIMQRQPITADSPWSPQLFVDAEGRWYKVDVKMGEDGKPLKQTDASGAPTRFNAYTRTVYATEAEVPSTLRLGKTGYERLKGMVALRDLLKQQLVLETEDATAQMEPHRKKLAAAYRAYVAEHGPVNRRANAALLSQMPDGALVLALESSYEPERTAEQAKRSGLPKQAESVKPAPILSERVVPKYEPATKAETPADALAITLAESGRVDMERIAALLGQDLEQAADALTGGDKPLVFKDPESNTYETADAYLSGQVVRKLQAARAAGLEQNIKALQAIQPEPWGAENVSVQMGATWVPADVYATFAQQLLGATSTHASFAPVTNTFSLTVKGVSPARSQQWNVEFTNKEGRRFYMSAVELLQSLLNSKTPVMGWTDQDGRFHVDKDATTVAIYKGRELATEFGDWIFKDSERRARLVGIFNERYNTRVTRQYDGQHLTLPGKVPDTIIKMRRHQKNAIWRGISSRFLLIDHVVGAGKTFTAIARAMERRRMGLARKPTIVVPNHLVEQWQADIYRLYPGAKVLAATKADFEMKRRRRLLGRVATGDYDIVVLPHSSFRFIGIAPETELRYLEEDLAKAVQAVKDAEADAEEEGQGAGNRRFKPMGVKEAERLVTAIENRIAKLREGVRDRLLTFEQLGIDDLTIDEAHEFKNLFYSSRLTKVRGMGDKQGSRKAADLYNKVRLLRDSNGSVVFMTGTPVSNSVVELYSMMRYLASNELAELGMEHFDAWRAQFVDAAPAFEPNEAGQLKEVTRLGRSWSNMRSLMDLYYSFTDAVTIEDIKKWYAEDNAGARFPVPVVKGGDRQLVKMDPTPAQEEMLSDVLAGFNSLDSIEDIKVRNATRLRLMDRARKLSLDARAVDPTIQSKEEGGKLEKVSKEVKRIYDKWSEDRGTQLIFLDRSVPKAKGDDKVIKAYDALVKKRDAAALAGDDEAFQDADELLEAYDANEIEAMRSAQAGGWNAYQQIKDNLVSMGIPAEEIRFVQEANTDEQKQALFDAVNGGKVRVLIGSTPRMGAGTNVQKRLVGLHHVDVTWKPSDIEQREGRIVRFGNDLLAKYGDKFEVEILAYATERTVDAKMWSLNATKLKAINGLRKYTGDFTMEVDDEESVSMAEMAALASGNPLLLERVTLEAQLNYLELQEKSHRRQLWGLSDALDRAQRIVDTYPATIEDAKAQQQRLATEVDALVERAKARRVTVEGEVFDKEPAALKAALASIQRQQAGNENARYAVTINGARLTNRKAIDEAIGSALGDASAFEAEVGGSTYTERTAAGRAVADALSPKVEGAFDINASGTIGQMLGMPLHYEIRKAVDTAARKTVAIELWLEDEQGRTVASAEAADNQVGIVLATAKMRDLMGALASEVAFKASPTRVADLQRTLERSKRDVAEIGPKVNAPFPKTAELEAKRARLGEVIARLTGTWIEPERKPIPPDTRGARPTWLQDDGNTPDEARFEGEGGRPFERPVRELTPDEMRFESDGGRASFAKSGEPPGASGQVLAAWRKMAADEGLFQFKKSAHTKIEPLLKEIAPEITVQLNDGDRGNVLLRVPATVVDGKPKGPDATAIININPESGQVYIDVDDLKEGVHRGSAIYAAALNYAFNNNMVFVPDPEGVKLPAMIRRTEHKLSSALKFGTTRHMLPHPEQGLDWRPRDDEHNLLALLEASADNVFSKVPDLDGFDYDWDAGQFVGASGSPVTGDDFRALANAPAARAAKAGPSTLRRALVQRSLARRAGTSKWAGVARSLLRLGRTGLRGLGLAGIAYGRGAASKGTDPARLRALFKGIAARLKDAHGIDLQVLDSADALPQSIRDQDDYDDTVQAVITADRRTVYLIANRIRSPEAAFKLAAHELVGHFAMEEMLGARLFGELQQRIKALADAGKWPEVFAEVRQRYERNADGTFRALDDATFASEAIAVFAEKNIRTSILQRAINAVRGFLRRIFPQLQLSQGELRQMLWEAGQYLEGRAYRPEIAARALGEKPAPKAESLQDTMERYAFAKDAEPDSGQIDGVERGGSVSGMSEQDNASQGRRVTVGGMKVPPIMQNGKPVSLPIEVVIGSVRGRGLVDVEVLDGGHVRLRWPGWGFTTYSDRVERVRRSLDEAFKPAMDDGVYWRFTNNKDEPKLAMRGELRNSTNHAEKRMERGVSVASGAHYSIQGYKYGYKVTGTEVGQGSDGEPLLDPATIKPVSKIMLAADIATEDRAALIAGLRKNLEARGWTLDHYRAAQSHIREVPADEFNEKYLSIRQAPPSEGLGASGASFAKGAEPTMLERLQDAINLTLRHLGELAAEPTMLERLQDAINPDDTTLLQRIKDKWADWRPEALGALTLRHLGELAKNMLPAVSYYSDLVQRMASMRNELQESGHEIMQKGLSYLKANREEAPKLFELLHDATIAGVDPAEAYKPLKMPLHDDRTLVDVTKQSVRTFIKELEAQMRLQPGSAPRYGARIKEVKKLWKQERERAAAYPAMKARWNALSTPAKDQWVAMRDAYIRQSEAYEQALLERIQALDMAGGQKAAMGAKMRAQFEAARVAFYVPLARWGEYWVSGYTADGERVFLMAETQAEQRRALEQMKAEGVTGGYMLLQDGAPLRHKDGTARIFGSASLAQGWAEKNPEKAAGAELRLLDVAAGVKLDKVRQQDGASGAFMVELQKTLKQTGAPDSVLDEVYQLYLRTLPDLSIRKNFIHRKKTAGYSQDALRAFAGHVFHGSFQIARLAYSYQLEGALRGAEGMVRNMATDGDERANAAGRIVNELKRRHEWVMNPQDNKLVNKLSGLGFVWYLGITPGAALVNLLQTPMVTLPVLASKYGANKATAALLRASKEAMGTYGHIEKKLSPDELEAYNELRRRGAIDKTQAHNLAGVSESDTHAYNPFWHKVMTVIGHLFHKAEVINREASGMAAYRLARDAGKDKIAAIKEAEDAIWESHFDYSNANRARFMQSGTAKVLLMFRQFALNMTWFLGRNAWNAFKGATPEQKTQARRKLAGVLGMHALFAGTLGLPLMSVTFGVLNAVAAAFGDDDEPWDAETEFRTFLRETLGDGAAEAVLRGPVQAATGVNIAQRVSLNDLWFRDADRELEGRAWANYLFEQAAGPLGGIVTNYARGRQLMDEGHLWRGIETMMPKAVKDGMKAIRFQTEGVNTLRGDPVIEDFGVLEALGQLTGLAPARVAEQFDLNRDITGYADHIENRRRALMDAFAMAVRMGDDEARTQVMEKMTRFSRTYPERAITGEGLRRSLVQRARYSAQAQGGVVIPARLRARLQDRLGMEATQ